MIGRIGISVVFAGLLGAPLSAVSASESDKAGILSGCTLLATMVMDKCEVRQVLSCEQKPSGSRRIDVYKEGIFKGTELYSGGLVMTEWRRGRYLQELDIRNMDRLHQNLTLMQRPCRQRRADYSFTRIRRKLRAKGQQEAMGKATIWHRGAAHYMIGGDALEVIKFISEIKWADGDTTQVTQFFDPQIGMTVGQSHENKSTKDGKVSNWTDNAVAIFRKDDPSFGLVEPSIEAGLCKAN